MDWPLLLLLAGLYWLACVLILCLAKKILP